MAVHSGHRCVCASRVCISEYRCRSQSLLLWLLSASTNYVAERILKWPGKRIDPRISLPFLPPPPLWLTSLFVGYIRWKGGGFVFCSVRQNTHVYSSARFDVLSPRNDRLGLAERKIGSVGRERERVWGENWIRVSAQVYLSRDTEIASQILDFDSRFDSNLIGIWLTSNNDLLLFFFKYRFRRVIQWIEFVIFVFKMQLLI